MSHTSRIIHWLTRRIKEFFESHILNPILDRAIGIVNKILVYGDIIVFSFLCIGHTIFSKENSRISRWDISTVRIVTNPCLLEHIIITGIHLFIEQVQIIQRRHISVETATIFYGARNRFLTVFIEYLIITHHPQQMWRVITRCPPNDGVPVRTFFNGSSEYLTLCVHTNKHILFYIITFINITKVRIIFCQAITIIVNDITSIFQRFLIIFIIQINACQKRFCRTFGSTPVIGSGNR